MKRFTIFAALVLMTIPMMAERVTPETARKVAETFMQAQTGKKTALSLIRYEDQASFQNFYVLGTEHCFVIVSADDCVQPILGYSTENRFGTDKMPDNLFGWLSGYEEQISEAGKAGREATNTVKRQWDELISGNMPTQKDNYTEVGPLISTQWNQNSPYNYSCPGGKLTGCVATAMAQIMKYHNYPTTGFGSHSYTPDTHPEYGVQTANFGETTYDWEHMINSYSASTYDDTQRDAVAKLMYHCGVSVNMDYGDSGNSSGAMTFSVVKALQNYFNYSNKIEYISREEINDDQIWKDILREELDEQRPIQYRGTDTRGGHSFICDGYNSLDKFHFNWGWGGDTDGFYTIIDMKYHYGQEAIIGIEPIHCAASAPTITLTQNQQNITLNWETVANASSYNVYRDYDLIGNTSSNSFLDSQVTIGNHLYFVRCVDSEDNVSLPSNAVTVDVEFGYTIDDLVAQNLGVSYNGEDATLQWAAPLSLHYLDYLSFEGDCYYISVGENKTLYWGSLFPSSMVTAGLSITSVSTYFYTPGEYTAYIYQCTSPTPSGTPIEVTGTYPKGWATIPIEATINEGQDVWVIFKSVGIVDPTIIGYQTSEQSNLYSFDGTSWRRYLYPFFISASLTDGNFTYNLYDNGEIVATGLNVPTHTLSNISSNTAHQYTVKTKLGEQESPVSNMAGLTLGSASLANLDLGSTDMMIVTQNSCLTITDELVNDDPDHLILEDGAQLNHNSDGVKARVEKSIARYTDNNNGWNFIASPLTKGDANVHTGTYDLYYYEEPAHFWRNYKNHQDDFTFDNGIGYLYANAEDVTLSFDGTLNASTVDPTIAVTSSAEKLKGFNLVGNPFAKNLDINKLAFEEEGNFSPIAGIYQISGTNILASENTTLAPCEGFFIQVDASGTLHFNHNWPNNGINNRGGDLKIEVNAATRDAALLDRAYVNFGNSKALNKFMLDDEATKLYIPQDGNEYAIVSVEEQNEIPVNFHAAENGSYTLTINPEDVELDYLHLLDNKTGNDIDLLATPSYTFEAKTTDYASRFRLLLAPICEDADGDSETFAYVSDGEIIITDGPSTPSTSLGTCATLQVIDMIGRVILCSDGVHTISTSGMTPGVYVLRLTNGEKTRTQKIVIE